MPPFSSLSSPVLTSALNLSFLHFLLCICSCVSSLAASICLLIPDSGPRLDPTRTTQTDRQTERERERDVALAKLLFLRLIWLTQNSPKIHFYHGCTSGTITTAVLRFQLHLFAYWSQTSWLHKRASTWPPDFVLNLTHRLFSDQ